MIVGIELRTHAASYMKSLLQDYHILILNAGPRILRLLPPLIVEEAHVDEVLAALCAVLPE